MGFNRWSPYNYGHNNTKGWRIYYTDEDAGRIFTQLRCPTNKDQWLESLQVAGEIWSELADDYSEMLDYYLDEYFDYQQVLYIAGYYVGIAKQSKTKVVMYLDLINHLLSVKNYSPEIIFEKSLDQWAKELDILPRDSTRLYSIKSNDEPNPSSEFQCSKCYLVLSKQMLAKSLPSTPICIDCC